LLKYVMNQSVLTRRQQIGKENTCHRCKKEIVIGEQVVSLKTKFHGAKIFHKSCYEETLI
jgi:hypothetical protein